MSPRITNFILLFVLGASLFAIYEAFRVPDEAPLSKAAQNSTPRAEDETTWPIVAENGPAQTTNSASTVRMNQNPEVAAAQNARIQNVQQRLEDQAARLATLRAQQQQQLRQLNIVNPQLMSQHRYDIQNLSDLLSNQRLAEGDINQMAQSLLNDQSSNERFLRDQLELNIQQLTEAIQQNQNLLYSPLPSGVVTGTERQNYLYDLQNTIGAQVDQLQFLRQQRVELSAVVADQNASVQVAAQNEKSALVDDQTAIQGQIFTLRDEIRSVQDSTNQIRMSLIPLNQQVDQAQRDYENLQNQARSIQ